MEEGSFGSVFSADRYTLEQDPKYFEYIKERLTFECGRYLVPSIIDSGKHHVVKLDMYRVDNPAFDKIDFYIKGSHFYAKTHSIYIPVMEEFSLPATAKPCCRWCGNVLTLDSRGGCSACGGWVKNGKANE